MANRNTPPVDDIFHYLALAMAPGVGTTRFAELLRRFKSPRAVFKAPYKELIQVQGVGPDTAKALVRFDWRDQVKAEMERAGQAGYRLITLASDRYPERLKQIPDPPPLLWVDGLMHPPDPPSVAIVGSRAASEYGLATARRLAGELARAGVTVVSGVALGVDAAAHWGALESGGQTIGVLGCGLDRVYPAANRKLFDRIPEAGALVSEYPLGALPKAGHFPRRNRIIAGLSQAVVVVEAAEKSGALITARLALEQNRDVLAVPGRTDALKSRGTNMLLKQGARLVETAADILEDIVPQIEHELVRDEPSPSLTDEERVIMNALSDGDAHIDALARQTGWSTPELTARLLNMEINGLVRQLPGMRYIKN